MKRKRRKLTKKRLEIRSNRENIQRAKFNPEIIKTLRKKYDK